MARYNSEREALRQTPISEIARQVAEDRALKTPEELYRDLAEITAYSQKVSRRLAQLDRAADLRNRRYIG